MSVEVFGKNSCYCRYCSTSFCCGHHCVLQRFAVDMVIVSDLVYIDDVPKGDDGMPREKGTLESVRRTVWEMFYVDDAGVPSTSLRGLASMMDVIVVAC